MHGSKKSRIHQPFAKRISQLQSDAKNLSQSFTGGEQRKWQIPEGLKTRSLLDVPKLHDPDFDRREINANYDEAVKSAESPGTSGDTVSLKQQIDYMATEERAFRFRHATTVRCMSMSHGRRDGHGKGNGIFDSVYRQAENVTKGQS